MRIYPHSRPLLLLVAALATASGQRVLAQFPAAKGDDTTSSIAVFRIAVRPEFESLMDTDNNPMTFTSYPGYDFSTKRLTSPLLLQPNTLIGRSAPGVHPLGTVQVG